MAKTFYLVNETTNRAIATDMPEYWLEKEGYKLCTKTVYDKARHDECKQKLLTFVKPGDTIYTIIRHVSSSGMSRRISLVVPTDDGKIQDITWLVAGLLGHKLDDRAQGITIQGCGMDMAWELVYRTGGKLWPNGTPTPHGMRNGEPDSNGGYALKKESL